LRGARFLPRAWRGAWGVLALLAALLALPAATPDRLAGWPALAVAGLQFVVLLMATGALLRLAVGAPGVGPGGLQLGRLEARLVWTRRIWPRRRPCRPGRRCCCGA